MRKVVYAFVAFVLMLPVAGCAYAYEESPVVVATEDGSTPPDYTHMTIQELLSPKGAVYGQGLSKPLPSSGPCSYVEAVISHTDVDHQFPTKMFAGVGRGLSMVRVELGIVIVYRTHVFEQLKWETPEARNTPAQVIKITNNSFEALLQRDEDLGALLEQMKSMGPFVHSPFFVVDKACLLGSGGSVQYS